MKTIHKTLHIRPPSLRAIAAFEAAARTASFTAAARELNLTPSAVSHAIRALEQQIGRRLFERRARNVRLSAAGLEFAARVRMGLALITDACGNGARPEVEVLTISTTVSIAQKLLLPRLAAFGRAFPGLGVRLMISDALADFSGDGVDLAVRFGPGEWAGLTHRLLARETLTPMCSPGYRNKNLPRTIEDLRQCNLIHHPASSWRLWLEPLGLDERDFPSTLFVDDGATVLDAARRGLGIALGRTLLAREDLAGGQLVQLFDRSVAAEYVYACAWPPGARNRVLAERFSDWLASTLVEHGSERSHREGRRTGSRRNREGRTGD